ncbi:MAG: ComF family protein [Ignavibacterium sp.]|nr:ComF family protein [Ignavibacterium sp.]
MANEKPVCSDCLISILIADEQRLKDEYDRNFSSAKVIKDFYSRFVFETDKTLQHIIHALKYNRQFKLGVFLGEILSEGIKSRGWQIDLIVPVPIHPLKKVERGYNQSDYIVKGLSKSLKIPYSTKLIKRTRHTESQTKLKMKARAQNVADAFDVRNPKKLSGKNILIVDDIITTGATIQECGRALVKGGAKTVYACSVGIANF